MRREGWDTLLHKHLVDGASIPFTWGEHDCALWCADWVKKVIGKDFAADWRGRYFNEETLQEMMMAAGYTSPEEIADATLQPSTPISFAQRGDVVLHPTQACLGICNGMFAHFLTMSGITRVKTLNCRKAWKV